jgi:hypothetical protein
MFRIPRLVDAIAFVLTSAVGGQALAIDSGAVAVAALTPRAAVEAGEGPSAAGWSTSYEASPATYRWSLGRGAFDFGLHVDARPLATRPLDARADSAVPLDAAAPSLSVGLRSTSIRSDPSASSLLERALGRRGGDSYERKVGIEWKPVQSRLFLGQGLGIRLDGDDRLTMRLRKGSLGIYMQGNF